jgi:Tfp pilus assembly protein PilN
MNIDINILPKEMRAKPLLDAPTLALIVVILLLAFGSIYYYHAKSSSQSDIANMQSQITTMQQQATALSSNKDALALINEINQLKAAKQSYDAFLASKMPVGNALAAVYSSAAQVGVDISTITQSANMLVITGTASSFTNVSDYGRALDNDYRFSLLGLPSYSDGAFTLTISVKMEGGQ